MMLCPRCGNCPVRVTETRETEGNTIRRRRKCVHCGYAFTTYEKIVGKHEPIEY